MKKIIRLVLGLSLAATLVQCTSTAPSSKDAAVATSSNQDVADIYGDLFDRVQMAPVFADSKYFVDMIPKEAPEKIMSLYRQQHPQSKEQLQAFVADHFLPPTEVQSEFKAAAGESIDQHIKTLWTYLKRQPDDEKQAASSLLPLPYAYIVPGGRFREIYYWDSYFTQLGLLADHEEATFQAMVRNFAYLVQDIGHIPNGNRNYYRSRSQPPFFSYMISLWQERYGAKSAAQFLPALKAEYDFWMEGASSLQPGQAHAHVVRLQDGVLNRYWDEKATPRPEAYKEDMKLAAKALASGQASADIYRQLRSGAESGWDYSTRWFKDPQEFTSIQTTNILPVDLNALLYHLEVKLADLSDVSGDAVAAQLYRDLAMARRRLMQKYFWDEQQGVYLDYNWSEQKRSEEITVAMVVPLFAGIATAKQAERVGTALEKNLLKAGGLVTTNIRSGQQWDAPNGWPPHQWMAYAGLRHYGLKSLAEKIRQCWLKLNRKVYASTGKLMEKYNVIDLSLKSGGGEYPLQDGFGWTNGVYRALSAPEASLRHLRE